MILSLDSLFEDPNVNGYIALVAEALSRNYNKSLDEVSCMLNEHRDTLLGVFGEDPEIVMHDVPAKWAEIFAVRFGWTEQRIIEFI